MFTDVLSHGFAFKVREGVVRFHLVSMMNDLIVADGLACVLPPDQMVLVAIPATIQLAGIVRWRDNQGVTTVSHPGILTHMDWNG